MSNIAILSRLSTLRGLGKCKSNSAIVNFFNSQVSSSTKRITRLPRRLPVESSCLLSMLPLHSAIASARLQSALSVDSQTWCLVPQGNSMPL
ncbi:unnamed protein product [Amaranthus hypochondriacus]